MKNNKKIAIGVLAYNEEKHIGDVLSELEKLGVPIFVVNDSSTDRTREILDEFYSRKVIEVINNKKNKGAGHSTLQLLKKTKSENFKYLLKVDGDNQFKVSDIKRVINLLETEKFDFIKSNRFWSKGIEGNIPNKRYLGNLFATMLIQFISGSNKIYDPLNGLFAIDVKVLDIINPKVFPKRYGYPFYFSALSAISFYKIYQINNIVSYAGQKSNLSSIKMIFTLSKLLLYFLFLKIKNKLLIGKYQRSAFLDIVSLIFLFITFILTIRFILIFTPIQIFGTSFIGSWALIVLITSIFNILLFVESFKEEKAIRKNYIQNEDLIE